MPEACVCRWFGMFKRFTSRGPSPQVGGYIGHFGLQDWWLSEFTEAEREQIVSRYGTAGRLAHGEIAFTTQTKLGLIWSLASFLQRPEHRHLGYCVLAMGESLIDDRTEALDAHFFYHQKIVTWYKHRTRDPDALGKAIEACYQQIALSKLAMKALKRKYPRSGPFGHQGFYQLGVILEQQERYEEAIKNAELAQVEGWAGDNWAGRIARCRGKLEVGG